MLRNHASEHFLALWQRQELSMHDLRCGILSAPFNAVFPFTQPPRRHGVAVACMILLWSVPSPPQILYGQPPQVAPISETISVDILLSGGTVIDGSGAAAQQANVAIQDGKILLPSSNQTVNASWEIDCT
ncbi:MAG TPA: hypothetical protein DEF45_05340, partial [Rhodopirellula sp.]|nr:hypothetical protein [Rhodopirellula sp.]